jgi:hypothetical protein
MKTELLGREGVTEVVDLTFRVRKERQLFHIVRIRKEWVGWPERLRCGISEGVEVRI